MAHSHRCERTSWAACCGPTISGRRGRRRARALDGGELHAVEDRAVLEAIALQEARASM